MKKLLALLTIGSLAGLLGLSNAALADHHGDKDKDKPAEEASDTAKEAVDKDMPEEASDMAEEKSGKDKEDSDDDSDGDGDGTA